MEKKKIALFFPVFIKGGSEMVVAWTIEALKSTYDITLFTYDRLEKILSWNAFFGTHLEKGHIKIINPRFSFFWRNVKGFNFLKYHLLARYFKKNSRDDFDVLMGMYKEIDFGRRGIQYIHVPDLSRQDAQENQSDITYYRNHFWGKMYEKFCYAVSNFTKERMRQNLTLVNSRWTGRKVRNRLQTSSVTLYPPVVFRLPPVREESRPNGFLYIGRIVVEKEIEKMVSILSRVRKKHPDLVFHIAGEASDPAYLGKIKNLCAVNREWCFLHPTLEGREKFRFMSGFPYGIFGCRNEAFGIAIAEMVKAGAIVFVPEGGGQVEVVDNPSLVYKDEDDAVRKILAVLGDASLKETLAKHLAFQGEKFSLDNFRKSMEDVLEDFLLEKHT